MKKWLLIILLAVAFTSPAFATTKTVAKSGADFTSIQAAIDSFTEAQVTDGEPDVVEILDGEEYDEQVIIGNLIPNPEGKSPGYLDAAIALAKQSDPFTLRGKDPQNRPKINPISEGNAYGVFTDDPGDNFYASLSYMGKDITVENVEILQASSIDGDQYGLNGQAGNMVFKNVLFAHEGEIQPGEALINFNNAVDIAAEGFDNSYTFIDCTFDAVFQGQRNDNIDSIYFHGYSASDAEAAGVNLEDVPVNVTFEGCLFTNNETATIIRGRDQANHVVYRECVLTGNKHGIRGSGQGSVLVERCIFYNNQNVAEDIVSDLGALELVGRSGFTPALTVRHCLFVDNMSADAENYAGSSGLGTRAAAIRIRNDGTDPDFLIENCTFVNNPFAIRAVDGSARPRKGQINKCVFVNSNCAVFTADDANDSYLGGGTVVEVLEVSGSGNVFDGNALVVEAPEFLPNVNIEGMEETVTFQNDSINPDDPFAGPPYVIVSPTGAGADFGAASAVAEYMLYE